MPSHSNNNSNEAQKRKQFIGRVRQGEGYKIKGRLPKEPEEGWASIAIHSTLAKRLIGLFESGEVHVDIAPTKLFQLYPEFQKINPDRFRLFKHRCKEAFQSGNIPKGKSALLCAFARYILNALAHTSAAAPPSKRSAMPKDASEDSDSDDDRSQSSSSSEDSDRGPTRMKMPPPSHPDAPSRSDITKNKVPALANPDSFNQRLSPCLPPGAGAYVVTGGDIIVIFPIPDGIDGKDIRVLLSGCGKSIIFGIGKGINTDEASLADYFINQRGIDPTDTILCSMLQQKIDHNGGRTNQAMSNGQSRPPPESIFTIPIGHLAPDGLEPAPCQWRMKLSTGGFAEFDPIDVTDNIVMSRFVSLKKHINSTTTGGTKKTTTPPRRGMPGSGNG